MDELGGVSVWPVCYCSLTKVIDVGPKTQSVWSFSPVTNVIKADEYGELSGS